MANATHPPRRFSEELGALPDVAFAIDVATRRVLDVNHRERPVFGYRQAELVELRLDDLFPECSSFEMSRVVGGDHGRLLTLRCKDMRELLVNVRVAPRLVASPGVTAVLVRELPEVANLIAELREANRFLDAVVENIPDMIFVKDAGTLLFKRFNRAGEELLGWTRAELIGKTDHDFYPKEQADFFHLKDKETLARGELVDILEEPIETKTKGSRWLHTKKVPVYDERGRALYLLGISEDITARKLAEERADALEKALASLVQYARDAIIAWMPEGRIVAWNPGAEVLFGIAAREAIGADIEIIVPPSSRAEHRARVAALLAEGVAPVLETFRSRAGREIEVEESLFLAFAADGGARIGCIARDVGEVARLRRATEILGGAESSPADSEPISITGSTPMQHTLAAADMVAQDPNATILLLGETGVGKSWVARRIHRHGPRHDRPLFEVNCASLSAQLVESELFGHERGAFTGALSQKRGIVEAAEGGTVFLDEVGELPPSVQAQLLTFLDSKTFRRVGGTRTLTADVRLVAATNADLKALADRGVFRRDLYYRLNVVPIEVPPLRDRRDEIPELAEQLLDDLAKRAGKTHGAIDRAVAKALASYAWPGNVRELRNALERALILSRGQSIRVEHLPPEMRARGRDKSIASTSTRLEEVERAHILRVLDSVRGNRTRAAELLGISRSTLKRKLAELGVPAG